MAGKDAEYDHGKDHVRDTMHQLLIEEGMGDAEVLIEEKDGKTLVGISASEMRVKFKRHQIEDCSKSIEPDVYGGLRTLVFAVAQKRRR